MKSIFGNNLTLTLFGESHGRGDRRGAGRPCPRHPAGSDAHPAAAGQRRGDAPISPPPRREADDFELVSGFFEGHTTGAPLTILIRNADTRSGTIGQLQSRMRPSHADYAAHCKYHGFRGLSRRRPFFRPDHRPGGGAGHHLPPDSRQPTASPLGSHLLRCGGVADAPLAAEEAALKAALERCNAQRFPGAGRGRRRARKPRIAARPGGLGLGGRGA